MVVCAWLLGKIVVQHTTRSFASRAAWCTRGQQSHRAQRVLAGAVRAGSQTGGCGQGNGDRLPLWHFRHRRGLPVCLQPVVMAGQFVMGAAGVIDQILLAHMPSGNLAAYGYDKRRALTAEAAGVDRLCRERDPNYMSMVGDFIDRFRDFDLIVMSTYNFIHPELLVRELKKPVKVLGFIDDPLSTYLRGIPYLWAFDGAFFILPSYIDNLLFDRAINRWGSKLGTWWPLVPYPFQRPQRADEAFFRDRDGDVVYLGNPCASKVERLIRLKHHFGSRLRVHGRWPFKGYIGYVRQLLGKPVYPYRVTSLSTENRTRLYWRAKIGFNMHVSDHPYETGNMRMYETPAHGMMMVCDKAGADAHARIF